MTAPAVPQAGFTLLKAAGGRTPRVSVLVPAYNAGRFLREAVRSLLDQTWRDLEVLVIDDASTDDALESIRNIPDDRLGIARLHANQGPSAARNVGLQLVRGEYVALLDGDDTSLPHRIERQAATLDRHPSVGLVGCLVNRVDVDNQMVTPAYDTWGLPDPVLKPLMLFANPFPAVYMLRRSALPAHGFRHQYAEDYAMAADVARTHEVMLLREALVNYRLSPNGIMFSRLDHVARDAFKTQRALLLDTGLAPDDFDEGLMGALIHFGRVPRGTWSLDKLLALREWMLRVEAANRRTGRFPPGHLRQACSCVWEQVLLNATKQERLPPSPVWLARLWTYGLERGSTSMRARSLAHALLNLFRRAGWPAAHPSHRQP